MNYKVSIVIEQDEAGYFAYAPELPGCFSQGTSYEDAMKNIKEAVDLYLETLDPNERITILFHGKETLHPKIVAHDHHRCCIYCV